ncbi:MAG: recombinase family protein [Lachnospiraceae bacterium]|nr:recombinase family protein [Lachnospiraceae bacterium]
MARTSRKRQEAPKRPVKIYHVGIYARLSVDGGDRKNESIETQVEIVESYVGRQDDMVIYGIYTDIGKTGTNFEREGFERMMRDVRSRKIDCIVVKDLSRFGRNHIETGNYIEKILPFMGVRFIAVTDNFDSMVLSGQGEAIGVNLKNLINEMYARDISVKVKAGKRAKLEQGSYIGGIPAYGYRAEWVDGKKCLFIEETTSDIVKEIYDLFLSGTGINDIIRWLYENKVARPTEYHKTGQVYCLEEGLQQWSRKTVKQILTNPVYMGCLIQGCTGGKDSRMRRRDEVDPGDWSVKEHTHEAIISEELFQEVAEKFEKSDVHRNRNGDSNRVPLEEDLFKDVLYCGKCGSKMKRITVYKEFKSKDRVRTYSYICPRSDRIDSYKCPGNRITMVVLTEIVKETVRQEFMLSGIRPKDLVEMNNRETEKLKVGWNRQLAAIEKKTEGITKSGSEQYLKYRAGEINVEEFKRMKEENDNKADSLQEEYRTIAEKLRGIEAETIKKNHFLRALVKGRGKGELTAEVVRTLFERIEVYPGKRVEVVFAFRRVDFRCLRSR